MIYDRTDEAIPPPLPLESNIPCIHSIIEEVNKDFKFWINISNVKSAHNYNDNDNTYDDTILNQVDSNNNTIILNEYNTISAIEHEANEEYIIWKIDKVYVNDFSHNNNHNRDDENDYVDHYGLLTVVYIPLTIPYYSYCTGSSLLTVVYILVSTMV